MIQRIKLFAFYQLMAFTSLWSPRHGLEMIEVAQEGSHQRDVKHTVDSLFSRAARKPR